MEIEKKYQVMSIPANLDSFRKKEIEQGYLNHHPTLRIRKANDNYYLTYKGSLQKSKKDTVICNDEIEVEIPRESYLHLRDKVDNHIVKKTRYIIPIGTARENCPGMDLNAVDDNGMLQADAELKIELDVFHEALEGLVFAEVEFPSVDAAKHFDEPEWFGTDVSSDKRYRNSYLSTLDSLADF